VAAGTLRAELTTEQKKELFRKSHTGSPSRSPGKKKSASGKKGAGPGGAGKATGSSAKKKSPSGSSGVTHAAGTRKEKSAVPAAGGPGVTPLPRHPFPASPPSTAPQTGPEGAPAPASPNPVALPRGAEPSAPITIEKSGVEPDQGLEPAPEPAHEGFWSRVFGSRRNYAYLSASARQAIDRAPVKRGRWKYIVVHNSGTREGNARVFDVYHRRVRHMVNGLAYHFVIGDGHGSGDGQIEVGDRWKRQINGGHVASDYLNDIALGICLVGDFNRDHPTTAQVGALEELVAYLRERVGKSQGRRAIVHAHKEINPRPTDCPGDRFPYGWLHAKFGNSR